MCSHRSSVWMRSRSGRGCRILLPTTVVKPGSAYLRVACQVCGRGLRAERHLLLHDAVRAVLARGFDDDAIRALIDETPALVLAIPRDRVASRKARCARDRRDQVGAARLLHVACRARPAAQLADVARTATTRVDPCAERADLLPGFVFHPHGDVWTVITPSFLRCDLE